MDNVSNRYFFSHGEGLKSTYVQCYACENLVYTISVYGDVAWIGDVNAAIAMHEKKFHTERRTFQVYPRSVVERYQANWLTELHVHSVESCSGEFCVIHKPSMHHMRFWPIVFELDDHFLALRSCAHQKLHPDPDSLAYVEKASKEKLDHECCPETCCIEED